MYSELSQNSCDCWIIYIPCTLQIVDIYHYSGTSSISISPVLIFDVSAPYVFLFLLHQYVLSMEDNRVFFVYLVKRMKTNFSKNTFSVLALAILSLLEKLITVDCLDTEYAQGHENTVILTFLTSLCWSQSPPDVLIRF